MRKAAIGLIVFSATPSFLLGQSYRLVLLPSPGGYGASIITSIANETSGVSRVAGFHGSPAKACYWEVTQSPPYVSGPFEIDGLCTWQSGSSDPRVQSINDAGQLAGNLLNDASGAWVPVLPGPVYPLSEYIEASGAGATAISNFEPGNHAVIVGTATAVNRLDEEPDFIWGPVMWLDPGNPNALPVDLGLFPANTYRS